MNDLPYLTWFLMLTLTSFRLAWMLTQEDGPFGAFERLRLYLGTKAQKQYSLGWTVSELFNCPLCMGIWMSAIMVVLYFLLPAIIVKIIIMWLAISGLQTFVTLIVIKDE